jgi:sugar phosphate permease
MSRIARMRAPARSSAGGSFSMAGQRTLLFMGMTLPYLISYFQRAAPAVVGPEIAAELALSPSSLGILVSMYAWGYAAAQIPAGLLSDTWGARKTISACVLIAALGSIIFAASSDFRLLSSGRFLVGLGVGFVYVPAVRVMAEWYRTDELATYSGLLLGIGNFGALLAAAPCVFLMDMYGWRAIFIGVAVVTLLSSLFCRRVVRDSPDEADCSALGKPFRRKAADARNVRLKEALFEVFSRGRFYLLAFLLFCFYGTSFSVSSLWAGPYLRDVCGLSGQEAGNVVMMVPIAFIAGCPIAGYLSDKILKSRKKVLIGGAALHLLTYLPLIFPPGEPSLPRLHLIFLLYGLTGSAFVVNYACAKEIVGQSFAGTALGSINIFLFLGGAFFQTLMGVVISRYATLPDGAYPPEAYREAFMLAAGGLLAGIALFSFFREKHAEGEDT